MTSYFNFSLGILTVSQAVSTAFSTLFPSNSRLYDIRPPSLRGFLRDVILLRDEKDVVDQPVEDQSGRKVYENEGKNNRHQHHHFRLSGVAGRRGHFLLKEHCCSHDDGQNRDAMRRFHEGDGKAEPEKPIRGAQVVDPSDKRG